MVVIIFPDGMQRFIHCEAMDINTCNGYLLKQYCSDIYPILPNLLTMKHRRGNLVNLKNTTRI